MSLAGHDASAFDITHLRDGDNAAFDRLVHAYYVSLCRFADSLIYAPSVAEEIVQDVLLYVWAHRQTLQITTTIRAYLFSSVRHKCFDHLRRRRREEQIVVDDEGIPPGHAHVTPGIDDAITYAETLGAIRQAVGRLPEGQRMVFLLRWEHGLSYAEIVEATGLSRAAVDQRLVRALQAIRVMVEER